jgi:hypothetical protein
MPSRFLFTAHLLYLLHIIFLDEKWLTHNVFSLRCGDVVLINKEENMFKLQDL